MAGLIALAGCYALDQDPGVDLYKIHPGTVRAHEPMCTTRDTLGDWYTFRRQDQPMPSYLQEQCVVSSEPLAVLVVTPPYAEIYTTGPRCERVGVVFDGSKYWICDQSLDRPPHEEHHRRHAGR